MSTTLAQRLRAAALTEQPFAQARTLPGFVHHDRELFDRELTTIFQSWFCVGHVDGLRRPGDARVVELGNESVILTCDPHGKLNAFYNVCRHRGTRLLPPGESTCQHIVCPYHAWRYSTAGELTRAPGMPSDFRLDAHGLKPVLHAQIHGFVFVCLNDDAGDFEQRFADFPDLGHLALNTLARGEQRDYTVSANWKLIGQNFNECYHCPGAHPQLHRLSREADLPGFDHRGVHFTGGPMAIEAPHQSLTLDGTTTRPLLPGTDPSAARLVYYFHLFPNLLLSVAPDYVMAHYLFPLTPHRTHVQTEWLFDRTVRDDTSFDGGDAVALWEKTNQQDFALCENAHAGLASSGHEPGPYHPLERCVYDFDRWYLGAVQG
ncbi:MAG: aromatic ring-hydroxylating dioxygenase subunit alpha [Gammaproteobacteria bacterium]